MDEPALYPPSQIVDFDPAIHEDLELIEMANLIESQTGVPGTIYISTMQGSHGPRTKWFPGRPGKNAPCLTITIADPPAVFNNGLARRDAARPGAAAAGRWTLLNAHRLLNFWHNGTDWTHPEVNAFIETLQKLP